MAKHNFFTYVCVKYLSRWGLIPVVVFDVPENDYHENEEKMLSYNNIVVSGWYVRYYDLFLKYKEEITTLFAFKTDIRKRIASYIRQTELPNAVRLGVHIRRGDYATWCNGRYYYDDDTYIKMIKQFVELHSGEQIVVYVCGNDPKVDKEKFEKELNNTTVYFHVGNSGEDLCLLSECHYLIGAPSTFSLVASMYKGNKLYWIDNPNAKVTEDAFDNFDNMFRRII